MKNLYTFYTFSIFAFFFTTASVAQNLVITPNQTATDLVNALVGAGVNPTNITGQLSSVNNGIFINNGVTGFTLSGGIVLSTGLVDMIATPNYFNSTDIGLLGDPDLNAISPSLTEDAAIIEFDFSAGNDSVELYFVFSSEEYNEYANTNFNDVFAFFITGPGYAPNTNVALIPGTNTPISINNVNNGNASGTASGPCMNCAYYVDNVGTNAVDLGMDGYTTVIPIKFPVWPCSGYHFKIAVADAGDGVFDSAVMLEENSFVPCPNMQATQHTVAVGDTISICLGGSATLTAPEGVAYSWSTGETTRSIVVSQPATYSFMISDPLQSSCFAFSNSITVIQQGAVQTPAIIQNGNLLSAPNLLPTPNMTYQWSLDNSPITGATQNTFNIPGNGCYTLTIFEGACESTSNTICVTNTSIYEIAQSAIHIYPNPVSDVSIIETPFEPGSTSTLLLLDVTGRQALPASIQNGNTLRLEKGSLPSGVYFLKISNSNYEGAVIKKVVLN